ncbi:translation elongation factor Ts [Solemya velum gill symbiont]|uniref:Elongation factor Ts n=1 Tax=Solemya velum gill symbiont TaxID=2340 RepID=A0A0B0HAP3_SOVGS|nr:translation elongation factor Ts [Solemya velum gill symbiont]KHF26160.1 translation elongation factor Ts [Solemya velum gill symbiont]OOY35881.1 translation elongation factor Ts [Solemya velum gill symbiont]OOY38721.1 translation elongation factor Ts [Solemya velum gill symbiont]OOY39257.1 translation elongation factor Ts [Solemya velum gill symbiont]OOY47524.1 translation elongation factor Ts [Solemya velum gill symbiont]
MAITASLVKELRERTGAGMMECKKALVETDGDIETAIENMRKSGQAKAAKKAGRIAAEGLIVFAASDDNKSAAMVEVNCETDFVAKDENFSSFANAVAERTLNSDVADVETLVDMPLHDGEEATIAATRDALISKIGENMSVRRFVRINSSGGVYSYRHGVRIGVLVDMEGGDAELGRDIAMHIAASNPVCVSADDVPAEKLASEREIFRAQALESGKPEAIVDKIIEGRVRKYLEEITLNGQAFVKDPDVTVGKLLEKAGAKVISFTRYEVGEGIEKKQEDFAAEVMAQVQGS